eukprot:4016246-Lingulodinium_polyedra.AAC.1
MEDLIACVAHHLVLVLLWDLTPPTVTAGRSFMSRFRNVLLFIPSLRSGHIAPVSHHLRLQP